MRVYTAPHTLLDESEGVALKFLVFLSIAFLLLTFCFDVQADVIKLTNGKFFVGTATPSDKNPDMLVINLDKGKVTIPKSLIANVEEVEIEELAQVKEEDFPEMTFTDSVGLEIKDKKSVTKRISRAKVEKEGRTFVAARPDPVLPGETEAIKGAPSDGIRILMAQICHVNGNVEFKSPGGLWEPVEPGRQVAPGDSVRTGEGRVRIFTADKVELRLVENTEVTNVAGLTKPTLDLIQGRAWVKVHDERETKTEKILIRTEDAITGVTGSLLFVEKPDPSVTTVVVFDGHVAVSERDAGSEPISLGSDEAAKISPKGAERTRCDEKMLDEWTFWSINE